MGHIERLLCPGAPQDPAQYHTQSNIERSSEELYKMKDFYRQKGARTRTLVIARLLFFRGWQGVYQAGHLTSADQTEPD